MLNFVKKNLLISLCLFAAVFSLAFPEIFVWLNTNIKIDLSFVPFLAQNFPNLGFVNMMLCVIMFSMGMTLRGADFELILKRPLDVVTGIIAQYVCMGGLGWLVAKGLSLAGVGDPAVVAEIAVGIVLLGCVPGGTASNVMAFLAKGDVPLSITITMCTTLLAPVLTPSLTLLLAGQWIDVNFWNMFISIVLVVLLPIVLGIAVHSALGNKVDKYKNALVKVSTVCIAVVLACCVGPNRSKFTDNGLLVVAVTVVAVLVHHLLGLLSGYLVARLVGMDEEKVRTMTLEVGLQNSGLSVTLANSAFPNTMAVLPCVLATVIHQLVGPVVAGYFAAKTLEQNEVEFANLQPE